MSVLSPASRHLLESELARATKMRDGYHQTAESYETSAMAARSQANIMNARVLQLQRDITRDDETTCLVKISTSWA